MAPLRAAAKDHVKVPGLSAARLLFDVHESYYHQRPCSYPRNRLSPEFILLSKGLAATKAILI